MGFLAGDNACFDQLYNKYHKRVLGYLYNQTKDRELAKDISQNTWLKIVKQLKNYNPKYDVGPFIIKITQSELIDAYRRIIKDEKVKDCSVYRYSVLDISTEEIVTLLPPELRDVVNLRLQGFKLREISDILSINTSTLRNYIIKIRKLTSAYLDNRSISH